jgi:hypothetical protein
MVQIRWQWLRSNGTGQLQIEAVPELPQPTRNSFLLNIMCIIGAIRRGVRPSGRGGECPVTANMSFDGGILVGAILRLPGRAETLDAPERVPAA